MTAPNGLWGKVAIYVDDDGDLAHAASGESGRWTSKMGLWAEDIEHEAREDVGGADAYGTPAIIMRRLRPS